MLVDCKTLTFNYVMRNMLSVLFVINKETGECL